MITISKPIKLRAVAFAFACSACTSTAAAPPTGMTPDADEVDAGGEGDVSVIDAGPLYPAIRPPIPQMTTQGGPVLTAPQIFTVTFAGDPMQVLLRDFDDQITTTPWWSKATSEYCAPKATDCIGSGTSAGAGILPLPSQMALLDTDLIALLQAHVDDGSFPSPTPETIYAVYLPLTMSLTLLGDGTTCQDFHAYHEIAPLTPKGGGPIVRATYIVVARCAGASDITSMTYLGSHELLEAATDPYLDGFKLDDPAWVATHGGEIADLCLWSGGTVQGTWAVERAFSNAAASRGAFPCVPEAPGVDFNVAPPDGHPVVKLSVGASTTLDLVAFSDGPLAAWSLQVLDSATSGTPALGLVIDKTTVANGDHVALKLTLKSKPTTATGTEPFMIVSTSQGQTHFWPGVVLPQ